jgi:non-heme chloroperoxidase
MKFNGFTEQDLKVSSDINIHYGHNFTRLSKKDMEKPCLIFNYGLVCNKAHWKHQIPFFNSQSYPVLYHDYRFHYQSESTSNIEDLTLDNIKDDMNDLINYLNIERAFMIGHSMGVNTTLQYILHYPEKILGAILISGTVLPPQDIMFDSNWMDHLQPILELLLEKYPKVFKSIWSTTHLNPIAKIGIHRGGFNTSKVPMEFVEFYLKKVGELNPNVFFQLLDEMKKQNIVKDLELIETPSLIMTGDKDQVIPSYLQSILTQNLKNSEYYIVKDGSHVPQADFPDSVNERMMIFIEENSS